MGKCNYTFSIFSITVLIVVINTFTSEQIFPGKMYNINRFTRAPVSVNVFSVPY